jgi:hypothetical protein
MPFALGSMPSGPFGFDALAFVVARAGGGQANATQLSAWINQVSRVVTAADSVKLPAATEGALVWVINMGALALAVFPNEGDIITPLAAAVPPAPNLSVSVASAASTCFACYVSQTKLGAFVGSGIWKQVV